MIDMNELMKKAQELSANMQAKQEEMGRETFDVSVGGEMVQMTFNGKMELVSMKIDPEIVDPNYVETLQDLIISATNEGIRQAQERAKQMLGEQFGGMMGGMNLQNFFPGGR